jgi:acetyltransferase-like isoleucine patch superfamily enzyme
MRFVLLYLLYIYKKIKHFKTIKFNGFTVVFAFPHSKINLGKNIAINSSSLSNLVGLYQRTIIVARGGRITIGDNCKISGSTIYSMEEICIGNDVLIGGNCKIIDNDFHPLDYRKRNPQKPEDVAKRKIVIGNSCFIGANSIILKGSELGDNCVVGAGAVVSGKFPDNVIIAGNPAKIIKNNG